VIREQPQRGERSVEKEERGTGDDEGRGEKRGQRRSGGRRRLDPRVGLEPVSYPAVYPAGDRAATY